MIEHSDRFFFLTLKTHLPFLQLLYAMGYKKTKQKQYVFQINFRVLQPF